ncbi:HAMP domain-containing protein [candidate division WOR-3 bacterium]|nr:HAMP domain-containing protein [candidate division WOR-3 bacterium]
MLPTRRRAGAQPGPGRIQTRIMLAMLLSSALVAPVIILSLFYISQINHLLDRIVNVDVELIRLADDVTVTFLDARRSEKNFLLYRDTAYLAAARTGAYRVDTICTRGRAIDSDVSPLFDSISQDIGRYRRQLDTLAALLGPGANIAYPQALLRLRNEHQRLLDLAEATTDSLRRDSALAAAERLSAERELPVTGLIGRVLNEQLRATETRVTFHAAAIGTYAATRTGESRDRAQQLSVWGQRNIATVLLLVLVALVWVVVSMPRGLVLPLKRIANALGRAERGDLSARIKVRGRDELDQLARQLNRVFTRIRENDDRKTSYIQLLEQRFRLLAADIAEGVLVFDRTPNLVYANAAVESLLGRPVSEARGHALAEFPGLAFLADPVEDTLSGSSAHQECGILPGLPSSAVCIEVLRDNTGAVAGALVVITNPQPPAPEEPAESGPAS